MGRFRPAPLNTAKTTSVAEAVGYDSEAVFIRNEDGLAIRMIGAMLDLTERQRTRAELAVNEERLRLATQAAEVGFWEVTLSTTSSFGRPSSNRCSASRLRRRMTDFYNGLHPDDCARTSEAFTGACDPARRALYDVEYRTIGKEDGLIRWVAAKGPWDFRYKWRVRPRRWHGHRCNREKA